MTQGTEIPRAAGSCTVHSSDRDSELYDSGLLNYFGRIDFPNRPVFLVCNAGHGRFGGLVPVNSEPLLLAQICS